MQTYLLSLEVSTEAESFEEAQERVKTVLASLSDDWMIVDGAVSRSSEKQPLEFERIGSTGVFRNQMARQQHEQGAAA